MAASLQTEDRAQFISAATAVAQSTSPRSAPALRHVRQRRTELERRCAQCIVLTFGPEDAARAESVTKALIDEGMDVRVTAGSIGHAYHVFRALDWDAVPVEAPRLSLSQMLARVWKRCLDVVVAAATLIVLMPLLLVVAVLIRLGSPGPVIFRQDRVGADAQEARLRADCSADPRFIKIACDPRVTRFGALLRKTSIDELPQLWNVLRGEMSLVGPRPSQPHEVECYQPAHFVRLLVKPGVTGMWQVSGRSDMGFEEAVALDSAYIREWSPLLDMRVLLKTVVVVAGCRGAC